jgi:hypothetical protein
VNVSGSGLKDNIFSPTSLGSDYPFRHSLGLTDDHRMIASHPTVTRDDYTASVPGSRCDDDVASNTYNKVTIDCPLVISCGPLVILGKISAKPVL